MIDFLTILFWSFGLLVLYSYILYPVILYIYDQVGKRITFKVTDHLPPISIVIAAYNEEKVIRSRIENCLALDYPSEKMEVLIASDGSSDDTCKIVKEYEDKGIPFDETFALKVSELEAEDWISLFGLSMTSLEGVLIERGIDFLKETKKDFNLFDLEKVLNDDKLAGPETKEIVTSLFSAADTWGVFARSEGGSEIRDLVEGGKTSVLDVSVYSSIGAFNVRALVLV